MKAFSATGLHRALEPTGVRLLPARYRLPAVLLVAACTAAGVPTFSPPDLRHRRVSLLHLGGVPWPRIGELVGHDDLVTTARTSTHLVVDEPELDYAASLA